MYVVSEPPDVFDFNPRSREGSDIPRFNLILRFGLISIHAPVKGATYAARLMSGNHLISIHAPVKGATTQNRKNRKSQSISIHAPVKGATRVQTRTPRQIRHFNPRSREGSDRPQTPLRYARHYFNPRSHEGSDAADDYGHFDRPISIHASAKGAPSNIPNTRPASVFQSTLPRRERPSGTPGAT